MSERVILADCCEDWILQWGGFYHAGRSFFCPECGTDWEKTQQGSYKRGTDEREFIRRARIGPGEEDEFAYLAAVDGQEPIVERCCAKILLTHGERMREGAFECPVCQTRWLKETQRLHGIKVPVFVRPELEEPLTIEAGKSRPFLVRLSEYSPPRE